MKWSKALNSFPPKEGESFDMVARTNQGLEEELVKELEALGADAVEIQRRAVTFKGDLDLMYRVNLASRLALRVYIPWMRFKAKSPDELYAQAIGLPFSEFMKMEQTFAIDATIHSNYFSHSKYAALKLKDAIADHYRKLYDRRPNVEVKEPDYRFNLFIRESEVNVLIDSSGASLHKRGYRLHGGKAAINEVLAAGMLKLAGYTGEQNIIDPMCGSGTILAEALLISANLIPQYSRDYFSFKSWDCFDEGKFKAIRRELIAQAKAPENVIRGYDLDPIQLKAARFNFEELKHGEHILLEHQDFLTLEAPIDEGILVMNPPYGERLELDEAIKFYADIGTRLKHHWPGWKAWVISAHIKALKRLGLKPGKKYKLFNGPLECGYYGYDLFKGTLIEKKYGNKQ